MSGEEEVDNVVELFRGHADGDAGEWVGIRRGDARAAVAALGRLRARLGERS